MSDYYDQYKVYVLALENNKFYVGITKEPARRLVEHKSGKGAAFTRKYKPIDIVYCKNIKTKFKSEAEKREYSITCALMKKYGINPYDYDTREEYLEAVDEHALSDNITVPVNLKINLRLDETVKENDYRKGDCNIGNGAVI